MKVVWEHKALNAERRFGDDTEVGVGVLVSAMKCSTSKMISRW
jgi:hypothetical protein